MPKSIPFKDTVSRKWIVDSLSQIVHQSDPTGKLQVMLDAVINLKKGKTISATDMKLENLVAFFNITFDRSHMGRNPWKLQTESSEMPQRLRLNLADLTKVFPHDESEASGRIAVDMMLIACKLHVMELFPSQFWPKKRKIASQPATPKSSDELRETIKIYPEVELAVEVTDPRNKEKVRVTGRADWGFGYSGRAGAADGTFLVAVEAKRRMLFSTAEDQLLTYLAILRELRLRAGKTNAATQGFYTDGYRYCFMAINMDGQVESSATYDVLNQEGGKSIFNFIVSILESAMKSSPTVTPTKAADQREKEIGNYTEEVWAKVYVPYVTWPEQEEEEVEITDLPPLDLED